MFGVHQMPDSLLHQFRWNFLHRAGAQIIQDERAILNADQSVDLQIQRFEARRTSRFLPSARVTVSQLFAPVSRSSTALIGL